MPNVILYVSIDLIIRGTFMLHFYNILCHLHVLTIVTGMLHFYNTLCHLHVLTIVTGMLHFCYRIALHKLQMYLGSVLLSTNLFVMYILCDYV